MTQPEQRDDDEADAKADQAPAGIAQLNSDRRLAGVGGNAQVNGEQSNGDRENGVGEEQHPVVLDEARARERVPPPAVVAFWAAPSVGFVRAGASIQLVTWL